MVLQTWSSRNDACVPRYQQIIQLRWYIMSLGGDYMPIKISRQTGEIIGAPEYTQDQKDKVWENIVREWEKRTMNC